jgi:ABC-type proline/glycine betaine transport system substrate-binding protein
MMKSNIKTLLAVLAMVALAACANVQNAMPDWMPGSGATRVTLSGAEEVPPVTTSGSGSGSFRVGADGSVSGSVTTTGVPGMAAHIHQGAKGQNGPVIVPLTKNGDTYIAPAGAKFTAAQLQAFKSGNTYVNVHTSEHKGGEVRGQLEP